MEPEVIQTTWPWFDLLSPAAILISALGAWCFAAASIRSAREIAIKKSTFDYLSKLSWDRDYIQAKNKFLEIRLGPKKIRSVSEDYHRLKAQGQLHNGNDNSHDDATREMIGRVVEEHSAIKNILNEYEALAIAVRSGALDEDMIKSNIRQQFIDHVESCKEFIVHTRANAGLAHPDRLWCEVQDLAEKWK